MRTYTRKRPECQAIENVHELCRLCLEKSEESIPIFTDDSESVYATLALRIMICVGLEISREDCLPNIICSECYKELDRCYSFRKRCEVTYQKLKSHVLAVKKNQFNREFALKNGQNNLNKDVSEVKSEEENVKFVVTFDEDQLPEVNMVGVNGCTMNLHNSNKLAKEIDVNNIEKVITNQENEQNDTTSTALDISMFLTTMLIEMGILTQQDNGLAFTDETIQTVELETGDGNHISLKLAEEDEQIEIPPENTSATSKIETNEPEDNNIDIQSIKSNYEEQQDSGKDVDGKKMGNSWCEVCGKRLASRSALARHRRVHSGEKPYECRDCGRAFSQREVMLRHRLVHSEQRPYKCGACDKSFTQRGALAAHARAHAPAAARPLALHRCARCPKVFLYASGLSRHMMMHNGRVYVCGACDRQFRDKSSMMRHLKNANHAPREAGDT